MNKKKRFHGTWLGREPMTPLHTITREDGKRIIAAEPSLADGSTHDCCFPRSTGEPPLAPGRWTA
jgi:hypothetical protein